MQLPLFPLPNVVHFPATELALHVFEARYRQLVADLQRRPEADRLIGMVLLKPGWQGAANGDPEVFACGTAGRLSHLEMLDDGRSNIVLCGEFRFLVEKEIESAPYRQALIVPVTEPFVSETLSDVAELRSDIAASVLVLSRRMGSRFPVRLDAAQVQSAPLQRLVNTVAAELDLPIENKLDLLHRDLLERAERVRSILESRIRVLDLLDPYRRSSAHPELN